MTQNKELNNISIRYPILNKRTISNKRHILYLYTSGAYQKSIKDKRKVGENMSSAVFVLGMKKIDWRKKKSCSHYMMKKIYLIVSSP